MMRRVRCWSLLALLLLAGPAIAVNVGQPAPAFDLPSLRDEGRMTLTQFRGKVVLLDFWASWCVPCAQSVPHYQKLRSELADRGFELVAVGLDEDVADGRAFLKRFDVRYPVGSDPAGAVATRYALKGMPYAVLIDREGIVRDTHVGFQSSDVAELRARIENLLGDGGG